MRFDNTRKFLNQKVRNILDALNDLSTPEVEISDMDMLKVYLGERLMVWNPNAGSSGRAYVGVLETCSKEEGTVIIQGELPYVLTYDKFKTGIRCYPIKEHE